MLKFLPFKAPVAWVFVDPDTKVPFNAPSKNKLITEILRHRVNNGLPPIENLLAVLENYWCHIPANVGSCCDNTEIKRSFREYIHGGITLLSNVLLQKFVTQDVAERRAKQCATCPENVFPDKGPFLKFTDSVAAELVGNKKVSVQQELGNCSVCSCPLRVKVWHDGDMGDFDIQQRERFKNVKCWQLAESKSK